MAEHKDYSDEAIAAGYDHRFDAVQDELLELRDAGLSILPAPNGLVACSVDGEPSSIIRMSIPSVLHTADLADAELGITRVHIDETTKFQVAALVQQHILVRGKDSDWCTCNKSNYDGRTNSAINHAMHVHDVMIAYMQVNTK